jgi:hypothetical protein
MPNSGRRARASAAAKREGFGRGSNVDRIRNSKCQNDRKEVGFHMMGKKNGGNWINIGARSQFLKKKEKKIELFFFKHTGGGQFLCKFGSVGVKMTAHKWEFILCRKKWGLLDKKWRYTRKYDIFPIKIGRIKSIKSQ